MYYGININVIRIFLSHDVDYPIHGPGLKHILDRRNRFDESIIEKVLREGYNPYYNIPEIMDIEIGLDVRSTFFFRAYYDDSTAVDQYREVIRELVRNGWEIGLHINQAYNLDAVYVEKKILEWVAGLNVIGCRVHMLDISIDKIGYLSKLGFKYDSSVVYSRNRLDIRNTGFYKINSLIEFPITIMDSYLFTYMGLNESNLMKFIINWVSWLRKNSIKIATLLWHNCSLKMKGGRMYRDIIEYLTSQDDIKLVRGIDLYNEVISIGGI